MAIKKLKFSIINIKIQSEKEGRERIEYYTELFKKVSTGKLFTKVSKNEAVTLYPPFEKEEGGIGYLYGPMARGVSFYDKGEIRVRDSENSEVEQPQRDKLLDYNTNQYLFVPSIHRLALINQGSGVASIKDLHRFLIDHLGTFIKADEKIIIDIEKEPKVIEEIFSAEKVFSLSYQISYTNADALPTQAALFDKKLKAANIGVLNVSAESDHSKEGLDLNADILEGGLELAKRNGKIKSAKILPKNAKRAIIISNSDKPKVEVFEVLDENDNVISRLFKKLLTLNN